MELDVGGLGGGEGGEVAVGGEEQAAVDEEPSCAAVQPGQSRPLAGKDAGFDLLRAAAAGTEAPGLAQNLHSSDHLHLSAWPPLLEEKGGVFGGVDDWFLLGKMV